MDEAIQFYEDTYKNTANEVSQQILWENYHRSCWSLTEQAENRMVLHWKNIGGAGGSYVAFENSLITRRSLNMMATIPIQIAQARPSMFETAIIPCIKIEGKSIKTTIGFFSI